jgi:hypothetical protein
MEMLWGEEVTWPLVIVFFFFFLANSRPERPVTI